MKIPSLSRRSELAPTRDENGDGRIGGADRTARRHEPSEERTVDLERDRDRAARRGATKLDGREKAATDADRDPTASPSDHTADTPVVAGPKPRASLLATIGLVVGTAGALFVLTGTLAGYGIALGATGAVLAVLGLIATRRRHIAGKTDALLGIGLGLAAVVLGLLAMSGQFDWPTTDGDWVTRLREWLDSQSVERI